MSFLVTGGVGLLPKAGYQFSYVYIIIELLFKGDGQMTKGKGKGFGEAIPYEEMG